jgi:hypothetical protein
MSVGLGEKSVRGFVPGVPEGVDIPVPTARKVRPSPTSRDVRFPPPTTTEVKFGNPTTSEVKFGDPTTKEVKLDDGEDGSLNTDTTTASIRR